MTRLKFSPYLFLVLGWLLCSCGREAATDPGKTLSTDETRRVAMHVLLNRYPNAEITSETSDSQSARYRFKTNGVAVPAAVVVDRKAGKARFEKVSQ